MDHVQVGLRSKDQISYIFEHSHFPPGKKAIVSSRMYWLDGSFHLCLADLVIDLAWRDEKYLCRDGLLT